MNPTIKVAVVTSEILMQQGLVTLMQPLTHMEVLFHASNKAQALSHLKYKLPDIVLLSVEKPHIRSLEILTALKEFPQIRTIILLDDLRDSCIIQFLEQETNAILSKSVTFQMLEKVIIEVHDKGFYYTAEIMQVIGRRIDHLSVPAENSGITTREAEILHLMCQGKSSRKIAELLFISIKTVQNHRYNLLKKTNSRNQGELREWATSLYDHNDLNSETHSTFA